MDKMDVNSLSVKEFSSAIRNFVKSSPLPCEVKRLVLFEIMTATDADSAVEIREQIAKLSSEKEEEKE